LLFFTHPSAHRELERKITGDMFEHGTPNRAKNFGALRTSPLFN